MTEFGADRPTAILSCDALDRNPIEVVDFHGHEGMSQLYHYEIGLALLPDHIKSADALLLSAATLQLDCWTGQTETSASTRKIHGIVAHVRVRSDAANIGRWELTLVPRFWALTRNVTGRVFQNMTLEEIVREVAKNQDIDLNFALNGAPPRAEMSSTRALASAKRPYTVQYEESDYSLISRLSEDAGVTFYFDNSGDREIVVFTDALDKIPKATPMSKVFWERKRGASSNSVESVYSIEQEMRAVAGEVVVQDYDYADATTNVNESLSVQGGRAGSVRCYPGGAATRPLAQGLARIRSEEHAAEIKVLMGSSSVRSLAAGASVEIVSLKGSSPPPFVQKADLPLAVLEVSSSFERNAYENNFVMVPAASAYRPPRVTYRPRIHGPMTAIVVGQSGDKVMTEKMGRIKVRFPWDTRADAAGEGASSCWVRVAQSYAGADHGSFIMPRVGDEVVVVFEHGDPDRPLVVGSVYNSDTPLPASLPNEDHRSVILTPEGCRLFLDDKKGAQECRLVTPSGKHNIVITAGNEVHLTAEKAITADGKATLSVHANRGIKVQSGANVTVKASQTVTLEAGKELILRCGSGSMKMDASGNIEMSGTMVTIKGAATLVVQGGLVRIN